MAAAESMPIVVPSRCASVKQPDQNLLPGIERHFRNLPAAAVVPIHPRDPAAWSLPAGDWLTSPLLHDNLHLGEPDAVTAVWRIPLLRRLLYLTCRSTHAVASSAQFCMSALRVHSSVSSDHRPSKIPGVCAVYTVLRLRMLGNPLTSADLALFLQLRSQAGCLNPRQLRRHSGILNRLYRGHVLYVGCVITTRNDDPDTTWSQCVDRLLLVLEADLIHLICTDYDVDRRSLAIRLLIYLLEDSGVVESMSWVVRMNSLKRLLDVNRDQAYSASLLGVFCHVCSQWPVLGSGEQSDEDHYYSDAVANSTMLGIHGLPESSPLHQVMLEVDCAQAADPFCVYSRGVMQCLCHLRDGVDRRYAPAETNFDALKVVMDRLIVMLERCQCRQCKDLVGMVTMD